MFRYRAKPILPQRLINSLRDEEYEFYNPEINLVTVCTQHTRELTPGVIDSEAIAWYKYGNCAILALYIHRLTNWNIVLLNNTEQDIIHALVRDNEGLLRDIMGAHHEKDVLSEWSKYEGLTSHTFTDEKDFLAIVGDDLSAYPEIEHALTEDYAFRLTR